MINRIVRAVAFGFIGTIVGFYAVGLIAQGIYSIQYGNDPSIGTAIGLIAIPTGCPLGFTLGAIFGFRKSRPNN
jgi:hypothetical protein